MLKLTACAAAIFLYFGCAAQAATFISFNGSTGVFGNTQVDSPSFADTIDLGPLTPGAYLISATVSSTYQGIEQATQDIDFTSVSLNGVQLIAGSTGQNEYWFINNVWSQGTNLFSINGNAGSNASYSGTVNVAQVPEPSVWAMLVAGFAAIGVAMRRRGRLHVARLQAI